MGCAEVISLNEARARTHWTTLRQRLHERFDRWLDQLEAALPEGTPTLGQVSATIWALRQQLTGGVAETIVHHSHPEEQQRPSLLVSDHRGSNSQVIDFESVKIYPVFTIKITNPVKSNT